jgi:hypothetical protein
VSEGEPTAGPDRSALAIALWLATIVTLFAAALVWSAPPIRGRRGELATDGGPNGGPNLGMNGGLPTGPADPNEPPGFDIKTFIASPPVDGRPTQAAVDAAITKGRSAFLHRYVEPALANAEPGGFLDYVDANGVKTRLGPDVYVQCQLYLIVHLLMYTDEFGLKREDPLVQRSLNFLNKTFDDAKGRWIWSEEGCLHAKGLVALARFGERDRFEKGWRYALTSPMYLKDDGLFTMMQSGHIVQSLGPGSISLTGADGWEHGAPLIDEENSAKFLFALLEAGRSPDDPEVAALEAKLSHYLATNAIAIGYMKTKDLIGRIWPILMHARWRLPEDDGFRIALAQMRAAVKGEWRLNFMLRILPMFRADLIRALLEIGDRGPELDAMVNGMVASQEADGAWPVPHIKKLWGLEVTAKGWKTGNMDGANTYMNTLALVAWRRAIYGDS